MKPSYCLSVLSLWSQLFCGKIVTHPLPIESQRHECARLRVGGNLNLCKTTPEKFSVNCGSVIRYAQDEPSFFIFNYTLNNKDHGTTPNKINSTHQIYCSPLAKRYLISPEHCFSINLPMFYVCSSHDSSGAWGLLWSPQLHFKTKNFFVSGSMQIDLCSLLKTMTTPTHANNIQTEGRYRLSGLSRCMKLRWLAPTEFIIGGCLDFHSADKYKMNIPTNTGHKTVSDVFSKFRGFNVGLNWSFISSIKLRVSLFKYYDFENTPWGLNFKASFNYRLGVPIADQCSPAQRKNFYPVKNNQLFFGLPLHEPAVLEKPAA